MVSDSKVMDEGKNHLYCVITIIRCAEYYKRLENMVIG